MSILKCTWYLEATKISLKWKTGKIENTCMIGDTWYIYLLLMLNVHYAHWQSKEIPIVLEGKECIFDFWQFLATGDVNKAGFSLEFSITL